MIENSTMPPESQLRRAALWYARRDFSVIPINPATKKSLVKWKHFQTHRATAEQITEWWTRWPDALIGMVCGEISGITVVDCDTAEGVTVLEDLIPETLLMPLAHTPSGGRHYYFDHTPGLKNWLRPLPGLDVRTKAGLVLAPPSQKKGGRYSWFDGLGIDQVKPPEMPEKLRQAIIEGAKKENPTDTIAASTNVSMGVYGGAALARELATLATTAKGSRNAQLNRTAHALGQLVAGGELNRNQVETALVAAALGIGLNRQEVSATIESGIAAGMARPRTGNHDGTWRPPQHATSSTKRKRAALVFA